MHKGLGPLLGKGKLSVPRDIVAAAFANVDRLHAIKAAHGTRAAHDAGVDLINGEVWQNAHWIKSASLHDTFQQLMAEPTRRRGPTDFGQRMTWDYRGNCDVAIERRGGVLYLGHSAVKAIEPWLPVGQNILGEPLRGVKVTTAWGEHIIAESEAGK